MCECVFPCWTPTAACISSVNVCFHAGLPQSLYRPISSCVNVGLPQSLNILLCECVFPCWTYTVLVYPRVNVCFHAGLSQILSVIRLYETIGFELVGLFEC